MSTRRGHGEGTISKRSDGRWEAKIDQGWLGGRRQRKSLYGKTRAEVQRKLVQALRDQGLGLPLGDDRLTTGRFLRQWLEAIGPNIRPRTHQRYRELCERHLLPTLGRVPLTKLGPREVDSMMARKLQEGLSPRSVHHLRAVLRTALNQGMRWGAVQRNAAALADPPRVPQSEQRALSPDQARRLMDASHHDRLGPLYLTALLTGLRQSELLGLRWSDIDLEAGQLRVARSLQRIGGQLTETEPKTARSRRSVALPALAIDVLRNQRQQQLEDRLLAGGGWWDSGYVFTGSTGGPLDASTVRRGFAKTLDAAGLPRMRFHDLRHSCISLLIGAGVPVRVVMEVAGHTQVSTSFAYSHVGSELQREAARAMDRILAVGS